MTINLECPHCHKRYTAPATLAGKKIKCKHCTQVFAVPPIVATQSGDPMDNLAGLEPPPMQPPPQTPLTPPVKPGRPAPPMRSRFRNDAEGDEETPLGHPGKGIAKKIARADDVEEVPVGGEVRQFITGLRPSVLFDFPGAAIFDAFMPLMLMLVGLGWLALTTMKYTPPTLPAWVLPFRLGLYLLLFMGVTFVVCWQVMKWASTKCRFALPPNPMLRTLGMLALPYSMAGILWMAGDSFAMLFVGAILGAAILFGTMWLLMRLQPQEIPVACGAGAAALIGTVLVTYGIMYGVNIGMQSFLGTDPELSVSPVGPTFAWTAPARPAAPKKPTQLASGNNPGQGGSETTSPTIENPATNPSNLNPNPGTTVEPPKTRPVPPPDVPSPNPDVPSTRPTTPSTNTTELIPTPTPTPTTNPSTTSPTPPTTTKVAVPDVPRPNIDNKMPVSSPLVAEITTVKDLVDFNSTVVAPGTGGFVGFVKADGQDDVIEIWTFNPPTRKASAKFAREKAAGFGRRELHYGISANGDWIARVLTWPKPSVAIWSVSAGQIAKTLPLAHKNATETNASFYSADVESFTNGDNLIIQWNKGRLPDFDVINLRLPTPQSIAFFNVDPFDEVSGNPSISPDGRVMAVAAQVRGKGGIDIYDLMASRKKPVRTHEVPLAMWVTPRGQAFSPDGKWFAAFFEQQGRGLMVVYRGIELKPFKEHVYPAMPLPEAATTFYPRTGRVLEWFPDGQTILLYGHTLIDVETGKTLGDLGVEDVRWQHVLDKDTILLETGRSPNNTLQVVKLKPDALSAARAALKARPKP